MKTAFVRLILIISVCFLGIGGTSSWAAMSDYCVSPPFIAQPVPPLVMLVMGRDHKLYYQAYSDAVDLDEDGKLDIDYNHSIDYYGYFDPYKCYSYNSTDGVFNPVQVTTAKFCDGTDGYWSGNVLNWVSMSRMDALRKVLYGGYRSTDTTSATVLQRAYIPQDAHSWGKEMTGYLCNSGSVYKNTCYTSNDCDTGYSCVNKSKALIGIDPSDVPSTCTSTAISSTVHGMLVARYRHSASKNCGTGNTLGMINSYEPANLFNPVASTQIDKPSPDGNPVSGASDKIYYVSGFDDYTLSPSRDYAENYNIHVVTTFTADSTGTWSFAVDGDDDVEVQVGGQVVAQYLGCHGAANNKDHNGTINLTSGQTYTLVARHFEKGGGEGVKVWFKRPGDTVWSIFNYANLNNSLTAPLVASGNECAIQTVAYVTTGTPSVGTVLSGGASNQHLFCSTTLTVNGTPLLRRLQKKTNRVWEWSAKEGPVCDGSLGTPDDFTVRVKVCDSIGLESNCKDYSGTKKPTGLLQKYGEGNGDKVCSKAFAKVCTSDSGCGTGEGLCIRKAPMYFGLMSGSYRKNTSGGILRKNISTVLDEEVSAADGTFISSASTPGNIIKTLNTMRVVDFGGSSYSCGWIGDRPMNDGECRDWGNPIAEMMYETLRYFGGKTAATTEFTYTDTDDAGLTLPKPTWGKYRTTGSTYTPYDLFPSCSKPFMLMISDAYPSYDSDQIPGSTFTKADGTTFSEDVATPQLDLGVQTAGKSLLNTLADTIGTTESIASNSWYIGQSSATYDNLCTSKSVTNLSLLRGLCPNEPTKRGTYYSAALAYYGRTQFSTKTSLTQNVNTFSVALSAPFSDLKVKVGGNYVTFLPLGKSVSGSYNIKTACHDRCTVTSDSDGLHLTDCATNSFCPTNQIVNFFVDDVRYNTSNDVIYARYRINYEDVEQGADHDMDAIIQYEICTPSAVGVYGSCATALTTSQMQVKVSSDYASGSIDQVLGFIISGTTSDGPYLVVRDKDVPVGGDGGDTPAIIGNLPLTWSKIFTTTGSSTNLLKNPLWYAAKWGSFEGADPPNVSNKWAKNCTNSDITKCDPDNYYMVTNPLKLEQQLDRAFGNILNRATSTTAAAVANNRSGERGANIIQALFYPQWPDDVKIKWLGDVQALWFYLDPIGKFSGIFEDTDSNKELNLAIDLPPGNDATTLKALWKAGENLLARDASDRAIYTLLSANTDLTNASNAFKTANRAGLKPLMDLSSVTDTVADEYINYVRGVDGGTKRSREVTSNGVTGVWKLADVINSKPQIQGAEPVNKWFDDYFDSTYRQYTKSTNYLANNYVYAGSNGGMLHAFKLGQVERVNSTDVYRIAKIKDATDIGKELWAFIPTNALPYLKNCADSSYCHQYMVDGTPRLLDASINNWCGDSNYWTCERKTTYVTNTTTLNTSATSWKSVLIGSMGLGGATRNGNCNETLNPDNDPANNTDCIKTPVTNGGFSSYFALDVTSPLYPQYMWEFSDASIENDSSLNATEKLATKGLGLTTSGSAIVRINSLSGSPLAPDKTTNGRWFAVFGSGPTGPIDAATHQFLGRSDQNLKIYVVDLNASGNFAKCKSAGQTDCNYWVFDTGIKYAFAGPLTNATIDIEKRAADSSSFYSDDVVYIPYTKATTADPPDPAPAGLYPTAWDKGGIVRLITNSDPDPMNWFVSPLIDDVGSVTSSVDLLLNKTTKKLWVFFGEGRYFYSGDDMSSQRRILGIADPCYTYDNEHINMLSTTLATCPAVTLASLKDQTSTALVPLGASDKGWYINLAAASGLYGAERMKLSEVSASYNGVVFFPTFAPSTDLCVAGGDPSLWAVNYSSGGTPPSRAMQGKIVGTTSDQPVAQAQSLQSLFGNSSTSSGGRKADLGDYKGDYHMTPPILSPKPVKRIMSIQER